MKKWRKSHAVCATAALALASGLFGHDQTARAAAEPQHASTAGVGKAANASLNQRQGAHAESYILDAYETLQYELPKRPDSPEAINKLAVQTIEELEAGDIVYFGIGAQVEGRGIYIGNGQYVCDADNRQERTVRSVSGELKSQFLGGRRILSEQDRLRIQLILDASKYIGTPYVFGAAYGQTGTFDCSSFTKTVYHQNGIALPRVSRDQAKLGTRVNKSELKAGDLVFFADKQPKGRIGHVGIYAGDGMMIHTYQNKGVTYSSIQNNWWANHYVTARRIID
ncbi:NlpC/P60 family protein [Paenibacillus sp. MBLB4367]|uniref:NlpC/P60 family protein n=1 Tax=Paenibacillus sp. MBLB4367 TaxID=3384767 RepID=UPI0039081578